MAAKKGDFWQNWRVLGNELKKRLKQPFSSPTFVLYFVFIIVLVGGLGIWIPTGKFLVNKQALQNDLEIPYALFTYSLAMLAASYANLILSKADRSLNIFGLSVFLMGGIVGFLSQISNTIYAHLFGILGTIISIFLWWVANAENELLQEPFPNPNVATGGSPDETDLTGDLTGIET